MDEFVRAVKALQISNKQGAVAAGEHDRFAVGENVRRKIVKALQGCTDIVISHFHGDHIPMANANPFQLSAQKVSRYFRKPERPII